MNLTGPNPELENYLRWQVQQAGDRPGYWRLGVHPYNPDLLVLHLTVVEPNDAYPMGMWDTIVLEHHNAVLLAASLFVHAVNLQLRAGLSLEQANLDTSQLFNTDIRQVVQEFIDANRKTESQLE